MNAPLPSASKRFPFWIWGVALVLCAVLIACIRPALIAQYHYYRLGRLGAKISYSEKRGYGAELLPNVNPTIFLESGLESLDYLSQRHTFELSLSNTKVLDADLLIFQKMKGHLYVNLEHTEISDVGLGYLSQANIGVWISPENSKVSEEGLNKFCESRGMVRGPGGETMPLRR